MLILFRSIIVSLLVFSYGTYVSAQNAVLTTNLSLGSSGAQVITLQQILNRDPDTSVANTGPGSPGNETSYFGSLTKSAVIRFQEKYTSEVLTPVGLPRGNGYVGFYTRAKLNALSAPTVSTVSESPSPITSPVAGVTTQTNTATSPVPTAPTATQTNPNLKNLGVILATIDKVAAKQGYSIAEIATMKEQVIKNLATTTDVRASFERTIQEKSKTTRDDSTIGRTMAVVEHLFSKVFIAEHARAAVGVPFGGALLGVIPCNFGFNLVISPLPPTFVTLLYYATGSQAFLSYNIPATSWLLGDYIPGVWACVIGIVPVPAEGTITPMTGSSPL